MTSDTKIPAPGDRHLFLVFSTFTSDRRTFSAWYDEEHIPQVLGAPGTVGAQRFVIAATKPVPGTNPLDLGHVALYELEGSPGPFREEIKRLLISGEMVIPDFLVQPVTALFLQPVSDPFYSRQFDRVTGLDDRHLFLVFTRRPADSATYDKWYDEVHIPQIMSAPGMLRAQRFVMSEVKPLPGVVTPDLGHLALYEVAGDMQPLREEVKRLLMSGEMVLPDFIQPPFGAMLVRPVSPYVLANGS